MNRTCYFLLFLKLLVLNFKLIQWVLCYCFRLWDSFFMEKPVPKYLIYFSFMFCRNIYSLTIEIFSIQIKELFFLLKGVFPSHSWFPLLFFTKKDRWKINKNIKYFILTDYDLTSDLTNFLGSFFSFYNITDNKNYFSKFPRQNHKTFWQFFFFFGNHLNKN